MLMCLQCYNGGPCTSAARDCRKCGRPNNSAYKVCTGCAVRDNCCASCLAPIEDKLTKKFKASVFAAERKMDRALARSAALYAATIAPFASQANAFDTAFDTADREYNEALAKLSQTLPQDQVYEAVKTQLQPQSAAYMAPFELALAPYRQVYDAALRELNGARRAVAAIAEIRFEQICGHLNVDRNARRMMQQFCED